MTTDTSQTNIPQLLEDLRQTRFYGSLEIKLEAGRIVLLKKTETLKLQDRAAKQSEPMNVYSRN